MNAVLSHVVSPFASDLKPAPLSGPAVIQPRFPLLSRHQVELNNTLLSRPLYGRMAAGNQTLDWRIEPGEKHYAREFSATVRIKHQLFCCSLDSQLLGWIVESLEASPCFAPETGASACYGSLPEPVLLALCQAAMAPLNRWLNRHCGFAIDIVDFCRFPAAASPELFQNTTPLLTAVLNQGDKQSIVTLTTEDTNNVENQRDKTFLITQTLLDKIAGVQEENVMQPYSRKNDHPLHNIPLSLPVTLAAPTVSLTELRDLNPGDLLVLPIGISQLHQAYRLVLGEKTICSLEYRDDQFTVLERANIARLSDSTMLQRNRPMENTETTVTQAAAQEPDISIQEEAGADAAFDDIPVRLHFEVGSLDISLRELGTVKPGFIFSLNRSLEQPVTLYANGRAIGHCEFVQVGDQLAARVVKLG